MDRETVLLGRLCSQRGLLLAVMPVRTRLHLAIAITCSRARHVVAPVVSAHRVSKAHRRWRPRLMRTCLTGSCGLTAFLNFIPPAPE